ncbi:hypothetical protein AB1Y20_005043 [Prymnesium parvum]|uniref:AB hydrolase-1 domain-containing protein n=1 Tax=Prymnesium parvum TaxID=97485 RepID=A0AB34J4F7_PRYPA
MHISAGRPSAPWRTALLVCAASSSLKTQLYEHDGWTIGYRRLPASPGCEQQPPLLLIHPVGIGLSSWFWDEFIDAWEGAEVFVPDLIGCGVGTPWVPAERGLFLPLDWAKGCESLWRQHIRRPCVVAVQGGLAPVGVTMCARDSDEWVGSRAVCGLVMASPPTWEEMVRAAPEAEVRRNYEALSSAIGQLAFGVLENRVFVRFFSNLFLFGKGRQADERWLDACCAGASPRARPPIVAFNAGVLSTRSYEEELRRLPQPTLVLSGQSDKRSDDRRAYGTQMRACTSRSLPGANVLPWESPRETCAAVRDFYSGLSAAS